MKNVYQALLLFVGLISIAVLTDSCGKAEKPTLPKEQAVVGQWGINRVQLRLYSGSTFIKDTILPKTPKPKNYVVFAENGDFEFKFNSATSNTGTYAFAGTDSIIGTTGPKIYKWKMLTITPILFTTVSTSTNDPAFPGMKVETYYTLTR